MGITSAGTGSQVTTINTEHSLIQKTGLVGIYVFVVDSNAMAAGDTVVIKIKTKATPSGSSQIAYSMSYSDVQTEPNKYSVPVPIDTEIIVTLTQTAGTSKSFPWNLLRA